MIVYQCRQKDFRASVRWGQNEKVLMESPSGQFTCFPPNELLIYERVRFGQYGITKWFVYVFTGADERPAQLIPGVRPSVDLLLHTQSSYHSKKLIFFLEQLQKQTPFSKLNEHFWRKQSARMQSRLPFLLPKELRGP